MAFDGSAWNETTPTNSDLANEVDDFIRDAKIGVRSRLAHEHNWSASQTATGSDGGHKYITLTTQTSTPSLVYGTSTQAAVVFANIANDVIVSDKTGVGYTIVGSARGLLIANGTGTLGAIPYVTSGGGTALLAAGSSGYVLLANSNTAAPSWGSVPIAILTGTIASGGTIPLPDGYDEADCKWLVAAGHYRNRDRDLNPGAGGTDVGFTCQAISTRLVTCYTYWAGTSVTASANINANYMIIGVK